MDRHFFPLYKLFDYFARFSLFAMMGLVVADIVSRKLFKPVPGAYDFVSFLCALAIAFALPLSVAQKAHVQVEMFISRLPKRAQGIIDTITGLMSLFFFILVSWQCFVFAKDIKKAGEVSMSAHIPFYPFIFIIGLMCAVLCIVIIFEIKNAILKARKGEER